MIQKPKRFYTIIFSFGLLALLIITVVFRCLNAPIERDITQIQKDMTLAQAAFEAEQATRLEEQMKHIKPTVEYRGHLFIEGMILEGGDITHYCACEKCCGKWANTSPRKTADGTLLDEIDRTGEKTASCNWLPFDSIVEVAGIQYRIADRGGSGLSTVGRLDIYVPEGHQAALEAGWPQGIEIKIIKLGEMK
jgi:hypothetical protein